MSNQQQPVLQVKCLSKQFPGVLAVDKVSLEINSGEIHGLIGQNGSGKSTMVKCISGVLQPSSGDILLNGKTINVQDTRTIKAMGIATIFQEFSLVPTLSVAENIFLGNLPKKSGIVDWNKMIKETMKILEEFEIEINPEAIVGELSVAKQQMVEIAKALSGKARLIIMDEPTAAIGVSETENLHKLIKRLAAQGCAILYISHYIEDVIDVADKITVLRDGRKIDEINQGNFDISDIVRKMVGSDINEHYPKANNKTDQVLLEVKDIFTDNGVNGVSFNVYRGEVFGLAGLIGSGRTEIARALYGVDSLTSGKIRWNNKFFDRRKHSFNSPEEAIRSGVAMVTENRKDDGLFMNFNGPKNMTIASLDLISNKGILNLNKEKEKSSFYIQKMRIDPTAKDNSVLSLSGGNQQKVIISRWLFSNTDLFILDEPTRGIDVGAKVEVYKLINELTAKGKGIILISSEFPELLTMSDRIGIVNKGRITEIVDSNQLDKYTLMQKCIN